MSRLIDIPTVGEILYEEFMQPNAISAYRLAKEIHVPTSRIQEIIKGQRKVTVDTSLRLAKFFGVSDRYFINMQNDIDLRNCKREISEDIMSIKEYKSA